MARRITVTREQVMTAAVRIVRKEGFDALTAQSLAKELRCSTQPIYSRYSGMKEVREEVEARASAKFAEYLRSAVDHVSAFNAAGLNYIRFAQEEREFFKLLFMRENASGQDILTGHSQMEYVLATIREQENLSEARVREIYEEMWMLSHGIATMIATGTATFRPEHIQKILSDVYRGLIKE